MTDIHASIGLAQLKKLPAANERRRAIAARYDAELVGVRTPAQRPDAVHVYHQYTLRVAQRNQFAELLADRGVGSNVYYPVPIHRQRPFVEMYPTEHALPVTDELTEDILSIPVYPTLTDDEVGKIISGVNEVAVELGSISVGT